MLDKLILHWNETDHFMTLRYGSHVLGWYEHFVSKWQMIKQNTQGYIRALAARNKREYVNEKKNQTSNK